MNWFWVIVAIVVVGLVIWLLKKAGKKGPSVPKGPTPPPPEGPEI